RSEGFSVLAHPPGTLAASPIPGPALRQLVAVLRSMFAFAVLDLGDTTTPAVREVLPLVDRLLLVVQFDVPTLRLSRHLLDQFDDWEVPQSKVHAVVNRYGQRGHAHS